ncbi:hypothetical protein BS78_06G042300 [Paspalum vaginatum]|nr:hypothetical protein BS78_06G042300 [Paspalum vaginatum]
MGGSSRAAGQPCSSLPPCLAPSSICGPAPSTTPVPCSTLVSLQPSAPCCSSPCRLSTPCASFRGSSSAAGRPLSPSAGVLQAAISSNRPPYPFRPLCCVQQILKQYHSRALTLSYKSSMDSFL